VVRRILRFAGRDGRRAARDFVFLIEVCDPWSAITEPLPDQLDEVDALRRVRSIVYAAIRALRWTLADSLELIGRLAEIDRRITVAQKLPVK
jgi:hypothetical protein